MGVLLLARNFARRVQVGTSLSESSAFKNMLKRLGSFQSSGGYAYPSAFNVDGYPQGVVTTTVSGSFTLHSDVTSSTTLVIAWTGNIPTGIVRIDRGSPGFTVTQGASFVSGSTAFNLSLQGTDGYIEFTLSGTIPTSLVLNFLPGTYVNLGGMIVCKKTDYASLAAATSAGDTLNTDYVNALRRLKVRTIRTMDWINPNGDSLYTQFRYQKHWKNNLSFTTPSWIPNCWAGGPGTAGPNITSGGVGNAFVAAAATDTPVTYTHGELIQGQIDVAGSGTGLTINVGGRGAKPILATTGLAIEASAITANALVSLIYDDLLDGFIYATGGSSSYVPVEMCVALANAVDVPLWFNFPPHVTTSTSSMEATSSVSQIASLICTTLNRACHFEYANEIWNFGFGFFASNWALNCGTALGLAGTYHSFYGYKICVIHPQLVAAWSNRLSEVKMVNAFQAFGATSTTNSYRFQGSELASVANGGQGNALWVSYTGDANYRSSPNRPIDKCDIMSYATYWSGAQCAAFDASYNNTSSGMQTGGPSGWTTGLMGAADAYALGTAQGMADGIAFLDWDVRQGTRAGTAGSQTLLALLSGASGTGIYPAWEAIAAGYDGSRPSGKSNLIVECYEGGCEIAPPSTSRCTAIGISTTYGGSAGLIGNLITGYKNSDAFRATCEQQFSDLFASSHSSGASWFHFSDSSQWSLSNGDIYAAAWMSRGAVENYNY
jgi:hypothetical protein